MKSFFKRTVPVVFSFIVPAAALLMTLTACLNPFALNEEQGSGKGAFTIILGNNNANAANSRAVSYPLTNEDDLANLKFVVKFTPLKGGKVQTFQAAGNRQFKGYIDKGNYKVTMDIFDLSSGEKIYARGVAEFNPVEITDGDNSIHILAYDAKRPEPPVITEQPKSAAYHVGADAEAMTVTVDSPGDDGTLSYQWYSNNDDYNSGGAEISGAILRSFTPPTEKEGTTYYYVIITNTGEGNPNFTQITSRPVRVYVGNNAEPPEITIQPYNSTATIDEEVTLTVKAKVNDGGDLSFQWYSKEADNDNAVSALIPGATSDSYNPPTNETGTFYYYCIVTNYNEKALGNKSAETKSRTATVTVSTHVNAAEPTIKIHPQDAVYNQFAAATLLIVNAEVTDSGQLSYQWYKYTENNSTNITIVANATSSYFTPPTETGGIIYYYCEVTNTIPNNEDGGNKTATAKSNAAKITINDGSIPDLAFWVHTETDLRHVGRKEDEGIYSNWSLDKHYKQTANIVLPDGQDWEPIGLMKPFTGSYDGDGHTISNLFFTDYGRDMDETMGLFGTNSGILENIGLVNCKIYTNLSYVGGVAGLNQGTVKNCYVTGEINSENANIGGVVGSNGGTVQNCFATCNVLGAYNVGGVVGYILEGKVINCYATGNVFGYTNLIGGVVGGAFYSEIINCYATGIVSGENIQLVGSVVGAFTGTLQNCVALSPSIEGTGDVGRVTGTDDGTLSNNYGRSDMKENNSPTNWSNIGLNDLDGADITANNWGNKNWWESTAGWDFDTVWDWGGSLPILRNMPTGTTQNPTVN
jgi:hypothetical protein